MQHAMRSAPRLHTEASPAAVCSSSGRTATWRAPAPVLAPRRSCRAAAAAPQGQGSNDIMDGVKKIAKKIQGSLPIIGLLSRLTAPEGGFGEVSYSEFCRAAYGRAAGTNLVAGFEGLEKAHGKPADRKHLFLVLWMAQYGAGLVPTKDMLNAAKRLRVTQDLEIEIDRFENARDIATKKYSMIERPAPKVAEILAVAVDALATLVLGLPDAAPVPAAEAGHFKDVLLAVFAEATAADVAAALDAKPQRAGRA